MKSETVDHQKRDQDKKLTMLIFQRESPARAVRIPISWFRQISWTLYLGGSALLLSLTWGIKTKWELHRQNPERMAQLESALREAEITIESLQNTSHESTQTNDGLNADNAALDQAPRATPQLPTGIEAKAPFLRQLLGRNVHGQIAPESLAISLQNYRVDTSKTSTRVQFNLLYQRKDGLNQQGRIFIALLHPDRVEFHPLDIPASIGTDGALSLESGEYFSVGRFRAVQAEFRQLETKSNPVSPILEILLVSPKGEVMIEQRAAVVPSTRSGHATKPPNAEPQHEGVTP